ncbi:30S ribosomal protein S3 [Candidatus Woesearchaeota archaeon]|nr:30S ribosomal protein S3 [Candidatus Woesearchaeota archaeon]
MIERQFVTQKLREFQIQEFIGNTLKRVGHSHTKMIKTPLGEKIVIYASRPGLIVGRKGANIKDLTRTLKKKFDLGNPQIEINEVENVFLDANIVAEMIASSLERFGTTKFKGIGHKIMTDVTAAGALGIEILVSGKIPSARAKRWRFYKGYLKKSGQSATEISSAYAYAQLKSGTVGIQVRIMPPNLILPDDISIKDDGLVQQKVLAQAAQSSDASEKTGADAEKADLLQEGSHESEEKKEKKPRKKRAVKSSKNKETEDAKPSGAPEKTDAASAEPADQT